MGSPCKNFIVTRPFLQHMCTLFTCLTRFAVEFATIKKFLIGGICRCYGNHHPPKIVKNCYFCAFVPPPPPPPPQTFCAHFSHVLNDSHLTSTHTRSSSLGISAVAMVTTPQKCQKLLFLRICAPHPDILSTYFTCFKQYTFDFDTQSYNSSLGVSAVAMVTTSQICQKLEFLRICTPHSRDFVHTFHIPQTIHI